MIDSFLIQNYRLFKELHLKGLRRVNLFAGKNNTGKTALLEALRIGGSGGKYSVMNRVLENRGEYIVNDPEIYKLLMNRFIAKDTK